jgi:hypothetical protein
VGLEDEYRQRGTREETLEESAKGEEIDGENFMNEWRSWDFFNVMLVAKVNNNGETGDDKSFVYERDGIGFLHKNTLAHTLGPHPY